MSRVGNKSITIPAKVSLKASGSDVHVEGAPGKRGQIFQKKLFANGLNLKTTGDCAIIAPPLIAEKKHVDEIADKLRRTLAAL